MNSDALLALLIEDPDALDNEAWEEAYAVAKADPERLRQHLLLDEQLSRLLDPARADLHAQIHYRLEHPTPSGHFVSAVLSRTVGRSDRRRVWWMALAALLVIGCGLPFLLKRAHTNPPPAYAILETTAPNVSVVREGRSIEAQSGMELRSQDHIETGSDPTGDSAAVRYADHSLLVVRSDTQVRLGEEDGAKRVRLTRGEVRGEITHQPGGKAMQLQTDQATATVVGTRFTLTADRDRTRLDVSEGEVSLRHMNGRAVAVLAGYVAVAGADGSLELDPAMPPQPHWPNGFSTRPDFFPLGVWLQETKHAAAYQRAGINTYVGLWHGLTEADLSALSAARMQVICSQNDVALRHLDDKTIVSWMSHAEPDNGKRDGAGKYIAPSTPAEIRHLYDRLVARDPTRPIFLLFGQGAAREAAREPGMPSNFQDDYYAEYARGADILASHIYPVNNPYPPIRGNLWYVPRGVANLMTVGGGKPVWCWIETTYMMPDSPAKPTSDQVRAEVWMALIQGAKGIVYCCHSFRPGLGGAAGLLHDQGMLTAVTAINQQITSLAPVLNAASIPDGAAVQTRDAAVPINLLVKRWDGATYVFAVAMREGATTATFSLPGAFASAEVLGEERTIPVSGGSFSDHFDGYGVHLYKLSDPIRTSP